MTDRELLEAAARAAGIEWQYYGDDIARIVRNEDGSVHDAFSWNPITDDGDALRLAVKLRLDICTDDNDGDVSHVNVWPFDGCSGASEQLDSNPYAATRRAIVRAAAAMDKGE